MNSSCFRPANTPIVSGGSHYRTLFSRSPNFIPEFPGFESNSSQTEKYLCDCFFGYLVSDIVRKKVGKI